MHQMSSLANLLRGSMSCFRQRSRMISFPANLSRCHVSVSTFAVSKKIAAGASNGLLASTRKSATILPFSFNWWTQATYLCRMFATTTSVEGSSVTFPCPICGVHFHKHSSLKRHDALAHKEKLFACSQCDFRCTSKKGLRGHVRQRHEGTHPCPICGAPHQRPKDLQNHMSKHSEERPFMCEVCGECFKTKWNLANHKSARHGTKHAMCNLCHHDFASLYHLKTHLERHYNVTEFRCYVCNCFFDSEPILKWHLSYAHKIRGKRYLHQTAEQSAIDVIKA